MPCSHDRDKSLCPYCKELIRASLICKKYGLDKTMKFIRADARLNKERKYHLIYPNCKRIFLSAAKQLGEKNTVEILKKEKNSEWAFWMAYYVFKKEKSDSNDPEGRKISLADFSDEFFEKLAQIIIEAKDCLVATNFLAIIPMSKNIKQSVLELVLNNRRIGSAHHFARLYWRDLPKETVEKLAEIVINPQDNNHIFHSWIACSFAKDIPKISKDILERLLAITNP